MLTRFKLLLNSLHEVMAEERLFQVLIINMAPKHHDYFAKSEIKNKVGESVYAMHNKKLSSYKDIQA
jgi:hypothetical protein